MIVIFIAGCIGGLLLAVAVVVLVGRHVARRWLLDPVTAPPAPTAAQGVVNAKVPIADHAMAILNADDAPRRRVTHSREERTS